MYIVKICYYNTVSSKLVPRNNFLIFRFQTNFTAAHWQEKTNDIFRSLKVRMMDNNVCKKLNNHVVEYLIELMNFYLDTSEVLCHRVFAMIWGVYLIK